MNDWPARSYSYELPLRYHLSGPTERGVVICLHGFQDHALSMLKRIGWWERDLPFGVLAINAPFPVPIRTDAGYVEAYSWYFRDTTRGIEVVRPADAAARLAELVNDLGLSDVPQVIFGFSQGGYLAPYLARALRHPRAILACGAGFPEDAYAGLAPLPVYGLHGEKDKIVDLEPARAAHAALLARGFPGEFLTWPELGHKVDPVIEPKVRALVERSCQNV